MTVHSARWEYSQRAKGSEFIAILMVDWFNLGREDEALYITQARDVSKGSYMAIFEGNDSLKRWQFRQVPKADEMLKMIIDWQNRGY